jgi:hypothetical protein
MGGGCVRPCGPIPVSSGVHPEGCTPILPSPVPVPPASPKGIGGPVTFRVHDPCGSLGRGSGANRNWLGAGFRAVAGAESRCRCREAGVSSPFPDRAPPSGIKPCLPVSDVPPLSRLSSAGGPKSYGLHRRLSSHRRYGWLSPPGRSFSPPVPTFTGLGGSTFTGRSALLHPVREHFADATLSLDTDQGTPPDDPFGSPIPPDPPSPWLSLTAPADRLKPSERQNRPLGWDRASSHALANHDGARDSPLISSRALSPFRIPSGASFRSRRSGHCRAGIPAFIDSRSGLSHQPNISVRVGIPLKRFAGG